MSVLKGSPVSPGIAIGRAKILTKATENVAFQRVTDKDVEKDRFESARKAAICQVQKIYQKISREKGEKEAAIFLAHIEMLDDGSYIGSVINMIEDQSCTAEWAVQKTEDSFVALFESMDDAYMRARSADIKDISDRVLALLRGNENGGCLALTEPAIIVANKLLPSDTAEMDSSLVLGLITESGSSVCHAAIIARMLGIPFVIEPKIMNNVKDGQCLAMDGATGDVAIDPDDATIKEYSIKKAELKKEKEDLEKTRGEKSSTKDGFEILLAGNISTPKDVAGVLQEGGDGVGLFRTEFLYMNRKNSPNEEEQLLAYKEVAERMEGKPVIIRTLDIGGDKAVDYLQIPKEENPFLGYRAIRLCLDRVEAWKMQLRALLRASCFGNVQIMFPMISSLDELIQAKQILKETKRELRSEGVAFGDGIPVGMMIETPAAAIMSDVFAKEVDFFSIGTNDLIQYTMAADRMNEKVSYLYSQYDPAVLRFIKRTVESAHTNGIWVGICGEAAADKKLLPVWVGLGIDELSMSSTALLPIRGQIRKLMKRECEKITQDVFLLDSAKRVKMALETF